MSTVSPTPTTQRPRQQAGLACDECRRRKLRCDRNQPSCGVCRDSGTTCVTTTTRQPRGPRKGHLRALQSRIIALERQISHDGVPEDVGEPFPDEIDAFSIQQSYFDFVPKDVCETLEKEPLNSSSSDSSTIDNVFPQSNSSMSLPITLSPVNCISELMRSDLDHLYFDRVHGFFPILNKRHYFARARIPRFESDANAFQCLQHAMWTLAVSTSSQFQYIQDDLYSHTRLMIDNLEIELLQADCIQIEQVQAWALLSVYEFMRLGYRRGWMSAGKCFRFAVLMKLHNVDGRDGIAATSLQTLSFAEIEERRRTFWMAYTIDQIISLVDQLPLTFDQHVILTRRPCPEKEFQSDEPVVMEFLSDPLPDSETKIPTSFTESIQLVTILGQLHSHRQQGTVEHTHGQISLDFWDRHQQLSVRIEQALDSVALHDPYAWIFQDPMAYFTVLAAQAAVLMLFKASQTAPWGSDDRDSIAADCERKAMLAAEQMILLSKALVELSYFKIHPFTPVFLYFCGDFLSSNSHLDPTFEMQLALQGVLQALGGMNQIAQDCLNRLHTSR